jgi:hypothetical protein
VPVNAGAAARVNVERSQHASAGMNDVEAREVPARAWLARADPPVMPCCPHVGSVCGHEPGRATARRCVARVASAVSYRIATRLPDAMGGVIM